MGTDEEKSNKKTVKEGTRRNFLNTLLRVSGAAIVGGIFFPVIRYLTPPKNPGSIVGEIEVGPLDKFPLNSGTIFRFGNKPGLLIHTSSGELIALSAVCTHLSCTVEYRGDRKDIYCACHAGIYNLNGKNIGGPPPKPLERFHVEVRNGVVFVRKMESAG